MSNIQQALTLYESGFNVIPLGHLNENIPQWFYEEWSNFTHHEIQIQWGKTPKINISVYKNNAADKQQIEKWWHECPDSNIGILTDDLIVLDADNQTSVEWCMKNAYTPFYVKTAKGFHFYFRKNPDLNIQTSNNHLIKLDIRAANRYIVGAGSTHGNGKQYRWGTGTATYNFMTIDNLPIISKQIWDKVNDLIMNSCGAKKQNNNPPKNPYENCYKDPYSGHRGITKNVGLI